MLYSSFMALAKATKLKTTATAADSIILYTVYTGMCVIAQHCSKALASCHTNTPACGYNLFIYSYREGLGTRAFACQSNN